MSKGKRRQKDQADARQRRTSRMEGGGKSKYAKKRAIAARGRPSKLSPFYVSPSEEARALAVGASLVDAHGRPVRIVSEHDEAGFPRLVERVVETTPEEEKQRRLLSRGRSQQGVTP